MLMPRKPVPDLDIQLTDGRRWKLSDDAGENFTLVVVYRGLHCPICKSYLNSLQDLLPKLDELGVRAIAISTDSAARAEETKDKWGLNALTVGYGLTIQQARDWGLYVSSGISDKEPDLFAEPGLFLIRPDGTLYFGSVQTMPFARPAFEDIVGALGFVLKNDYPARGEVAA